MKEPKYSNVIIVLTLYQGIYRWFVSVKEEWIMDFVVYKIGKPHKFPNGFPDEDYSYRYNIPILDEQTFEKFMRAAEEDIVTIEELKELLFVYSPIIWAEHEHLFPSLFVNFDEKILHYRFPEYTSFDLYTPLHWRGKYWQPYSLDFFELIPSSQKYWIIDGVDYLINS